MYLLNYLCQNWRKLSNARLTDVCHENKITYLHIYCSFYIARITSGSCHSGTLNNVVCLMPESFYVPASQDESFSYSFTSYTNNY